MKGGEIRRFEASREALTYGLAGDVSGDGARGQGAHNSSAGKHGGGM